MIKSTLQLESEKYSKSFNSELLSTLSFEQKQLYKKECEQHFKDGYLNCFLKAMDNFD